MQRRPDHDETRVLFERLASTFESLDRWRSRSRGIENPEPGSDLAGDVAACLGVPLHELARHALISATQHLNLARSALMARDLYPIAHPSTLRGALIGSSRAVWLLWPDDAEERQQRALRVVYESHRRFRQFAHSAGLDEQSVSTFDELATEARAAWRATRTLKANDAAPDGVVITATAAHLFDGDPRRDQVAAMWMQGSGDAHGLPWPALSRPASQVVDAGWVQGYPRQMMSVALGGDLRTLVDDFEVAFTITRRGWSLFDQRCTGP